MPSCSTTKPVIKTWNEYTGSEKQNYILKARAIQEEASIYALQRSLNTSLKSSDVIPQTEPIYTYRNNIPQMSARIETITDEIESIFRSLSHEVQAIYLNLIYREQLNVDSFRVFIVGDSMADYILNKNEDNIKEDIKKLLDEKFKKGNLYFEWDSIFETYKLWCLNLDNISKISNIKQKPNQKAISLLELSANLIYQKWKTELNIGEQIAKIQVVT